MAGIDSVELRKAVLHNLINNQEYSQKVLPFLNDDYFVERHEKIIFKEVQKYFLKYDKVPDYAAMQIEVESLGNLNENVYKEVATFLEKRVEPISKVDYLVEKTEVWCQERAIINAVYKAVNIIGGDDNKTPMTALPDLLSKAIGTTFDNTIGHDYIVQVEERWDFYNRSEDKIPTGLKHFDYILRGGIPSKTLGVLMAGCVHPSTKIRIRKRK